MAVTYPKGMNAKLAGRLYAGADVDVDFAANDSFVYDEARSECRFWLEQCSTGIPTNGGDYTATQWPRLVNVIRRGSDNSVRVFQWSNGLVFEQTT